MKKLMIALGAVAVAAGVQAAQFQWDNKSYGLNAYNQPGDYGDYQESGTMYLIDATKITQASFISQVLGADDYAAKFNELVGANAYNSATLTSGSAFSAITTGNINSGKGEWTDANFPGTYALYQVLLDSDNDGVYISELKSGTVQGGGVTPLIFENDGAYSNNAFGGDVKTFQGDGWYTAVPEPTSGLLLLLGVAGLALRRRRA